MFQYVTATRGLSAAEFGLLKSLTYLSTILFEVPSGVIADKFGRRWTLIAGAFLAALGCLAYAAGRGFWLFAMAEIVLGISGALISGADSALLYDSLRADHRQLEYPRAEGRIKTAQMLGYAIGLPATDVLLVRNGIL
jgi:MFS family permease